MFAIASGAGLIVLARLVDRVGKGIRGAPRDALIADLVTPDVRGAAFGLRQSLDTVGAFAGPLMASGLMLLWANDFRAVFWVAVVPGLLAVLLLALGVREPDRPQDSAPAAPALNPLSRDSVRQMPAAYWWVVTLGGVFTLARFSEAFLVLRASGLGMPLVWIPLVMVAMNLVYALTAYPVGKLSDSVSGMRLLALGLAVLVVADLVLAQASGMPALLAGVALWGVHMGMTQGILARRVADTAPARLRGTAFGLFNLVSGLAMLAASVIAGWLWDAFGPAMTFQVGAVFAGLCLALMGARHFGGRGRV